MHEHEHIKSQLKKSEADRQTLKEVNQDLKTEAGPKSEKYPDPELYSGERGEKLVKFIFGLKNKFRVNANRYFTPESQLLYGFSRLTRVTESMTMPRLSAKHNSIITLKQLITLLKQAFDDSNKQGTAQRLIADLKMKNRSFMKYLIEFQQHIDATDYDVVTRKFNLKNELFSELKTLLIQVNVESLTYEELIIKCQQLNSRYRAVIQSTLKSKTNISTFVVEYAASVYAAKFPVSSSVPVTATSSLEDLMNLSTINLKKRDPLTLEERQHRMINHLCLYCGKPEHQVAACSNKLKVQLRATSFAAPTTSATPIDTIVPDTSLASKNA